MALAANSGAASFSQSSGEHLDLSDVLSAVLLADTFLLGAIGSGGSAKETTHYWMEDLLTSSTVSVAIALAAGDTSMIVGSIGAVRVGALLKDTAAGTSETIQVTAVSGTTLTIVRGYGNSAPAAEAHAAGAVYRVISTPVQENDTNVADLSQARSRKQNDTQIFKKEVEVSGTLLAVDQAGVPNELNYQIANRTLELRRELGMAIYHGVRSSGAGSSTEYRSMDGLFNFVRQSGGNLTTTSEATDENVVNALYRMVYDDGAEATHAIGGPDQITSFATIHNDKIRLSPSDRMRGLFVQKFLTNLGVELDLLIDRWISKDHLMIADLKRVKLCELQGRGWQMQPLAKTGDGNRAMIVGEYTLEVRNALQAFALHTNLAVA